MLFTYCCLVLPVMCISLVLRQGHATGGARLRTSCGSGLLRHGLNFSRVVHDAIDQWRKRLEACFHVESGHFEHLLRRCLPGIPVVTHQNRFFSEPATFEGTQQTCSQMKKFCISQVSVVTFSGKVGKWVTVCCLLRYDTVENDFFGFPKVKWLQLTDEVGKRVV